MRKVFFATSFLIIGSIALAQNKAHHEEPSRPIKNNSSKTVEMKSMYIYDQKQMLGLFKNNKVAVDFPAYNYALSHAGNVQNIKKWIKKDDNESLLNSEGLNKLNSLTSETK